MNTKTKKRKIKRFPSKVKSVRYGLRIVVRSIQSGKRQTMGWLTLPNRITNSNSAATKFPTQQAAEAAAITVKDRCKYRDVQTLVEVGLID